MAAANVDVASKINQLTQRLNALKQFFGEAAKYLDPFLESGLARARIDEWVFNANLAIGNTATGLEVCEKLASDALEAATASGRDILGDTERLLDITTELAIDWCRLFVPRDLPSMSVDDKNTRMQKVFERSHNFSDLAQAHFFNAMQLQ